jgi:hypothetical protein
MDEPFINPDVFGQMVEENTSVWVSLADSISKIPAELREKLLGLFAPCTRTKGSRAAEAHAMLHNALDRSARDAIDDDVLQLLTAYRERLFGKSMSDIPAVIHVELLAPTAIAMTFFLDSD